MLSGLSRLLYSWARGWRILALVTAFVAFEAITLPRLQAAPGGRIVSLDQQLFYRPVQVFATVAAYGEARGFWLPIYLTWDVANPIFYTLIFGLLISWLFKGCQLSESWQPWPFGLNLLPLGAGLCDLLENLCIVTLLAVYPAQPAAVAWLSTICTLGKMGFLGVSALLIVVGLVAAVGRTLSRKLTKDK